MEEMTSESVREEKKYVFVWSKNELELWKMFKCNKIQL